MKSKSKLIIVLLLVTIIAVAGAFALHHYMIKQNPLVPIVISRKAVTN